MSTLANESCVSFDTDALQEGMVPAGSWSKLQDDESDAAAVEEEARLATVQEVRTALKDAGIDSNNVDEWDDLEEYNLRDTDFDDDVMVDSIGDRSQEDLYSEYNSITSPTPPPQESVVISDDEDRSRERETSVPASDPPSPVLPPPSPNRPIFPVLAGFDLCFRFVYN
ncbi:hypothetical protein BG006_004425 [Podila minutissima]|uniref:Uncharacterized protein n=1 Tax=Podila minutissima TaxID=64525 RepID=A0A9P5VFW6_9FUNG|nr:hypothetical protein BG006_004425 [Podila minutissima]